jgi:hypothetical protein
VLSTVADNQHGWVIMAALHLFSGQTAFATAAPIVSSAKQMHHKSVKNPNPSFYLNPPSTPISSSSLHLSSNAI